MTLFLTIITFILIFSVLVLVHEYGHFFVARKSGIKVEEFGFGLPPRIWGFKKGETIYSINAIPFGGFVRLLGEDSRNKKDAKNPRSYINKPPRVRLMVVVAGVFMNFLLAYLLLTVGFIFGIQPLMVNGDQVLDGIRDGTIMTEPGIVVKEIQKEGEMGGLMPNDKILSADSRTISSSVHLESLLNTKKDQQIKLEILRGIERKNLIIKAGEKTPGFKTYEALFLPRLAIADVAPGSVFDIAGLKLGDYLLKVNNYEIYTPSDWYEIIRGDPTLRLLISRDSQLKNLEISLPQRERVIVSDILPYTPAENAGFKIGDLIITVDGEPVNTREEVIKITRKSADRQTTYAVLREKKLLSILVKPDKNGMIGVALSLISPYQNNQITFYQTNLALSVTKIQDVKYPFLIAPFKAFDETVRLSNLTIGMFVNVIKSFVTSFSIPEGIAGPVGIARLTHTFVQEGALPVLRFMAILSISLAIINVLPFPALDGGRAFFILLEIVSGRKFNSRFETIIHSIGFVLLMLLILAITYSDVLKLF